VACPSVNWNYPGGLPANEPGAVRLLNLKEMLVATNTVNAPSIMLVKTRQLAFTQIFS
jgi:hypothetical protein